MKIEAARHLRAMLCAVAGLSAVLALVLSTVWSEETLLASHREQQKRIGIAEINEALYDYHRRNGFKGMVVTNYSIMKYLPEIGSYYKLFQEDDLKIFKDKSENIRHLFIYGLDLDVAIKKGYAQRTKAYIAKKLDEGAYRTEFEAMGIPFITMESIP